MKIIIDTSILIDFSRRIKKKGEKSSWLQLLSYVKREGYQLIIPAVCLFEFLCGQEMNDKKNKRKADNLLSDTIILDIDEQISRKAAELFRTYQQEIGVVDYMLAATALVLEGELATLNAKHFKIFKNLKIFDFKQLH